MANARIIIMLFLCMILFVGISSCKQNSPRAEKKTESPIGFRLPQIPGTLTRVEERATYLAEHYWDYFNFSDTTLIHTPEISEQAFADYIPVLESCQEEVANKAIKLLLEKAFKADSVMFAFFIGLSEKYLYDPNSPMRNENLYIPVLEFVIASPQIEESLKIRPQYKLNILMKNRPGEIANDFTYTLANGKKGKLRNIKSEFTLLFFNNPDCHDCQRVKDYIDRSPIFHPKYNDYLTILAVCPDEDIKVWKETIYPPDWINAYDASLKISKEQLYDLKAIPTLYLLDKNKRVIMKDAAIENIEAYLMQMQHL